MGEDAVGEEGDWVSGVPRGVIVVVVHVVEGVLMMVEWGGRGLMGLLLDRYWWWMARRKSRLWRGLFGRAEDKGWIGLVRKVTGWRESE
jgi:hypothetical protein